MNHPTMQRRHFELIASAVNDARERHERGYGDRWPLFGATVIESITDALELTNDNFDRERFLSACGVKLN